jgi:hypothetical protein
MWAGLLPLFPLGERSARRFVVHEQQDAKKLEGLLK